MPLVGALQSIEYRQQLKNTVSLGDLSLYQVCGRIFSSFCSVPESNYMTRVIILKWQGRNLTNKSPLAKQLPPPCLWKCTEAIQNHSRLALPWHKREVKAHSKTSHSALAAAELRSHLWLNFLYFHWFPHHFSPVCSGWLIPSTC